MPPLLYSETKIIISEKMKKKLMCALARCPILSAKEGYCRYEYLSISPAIACLIVLQT